MQLAGYMNKQTITPGWYWVDLTGSGRRAVAEVTGEAPGLEVRAQGVAASFSLVEFICRIPTPEQLRDFNRVQVGEHSYSS